MVGSSGGHLSHLMRMEETWSKFDRFWVTFDKADARGALADEQVYFGYFPTNRNIWNLVRNTVLAFKILFKERPDVIISSGAGIAVPFFYVGKLFGAKLIYVEVFDRIDAPTMTGRLVHPIVDKFLVEWPEMTKVYKNSIYVGSVF
jgi:UDP-N-acetylglucosamine:LPS N-acetylglucosamine transferase